ncbi:ferric-chelate reductase 1-like [Pecten maximus]|uniref:ferric-chelate reductase 1-like n=1 Tax=Pecten maximus TaxID=6579 RepID=UPI0014589544|nr:ferric-chelate reductase 1-like [Pecten maximus]XP_033756417.1 ferric-chelate reductase 1-like [Pecten maximus]XP_033756418.1 ferric-chelate reductase 1-like [Pecten maximus]
MSLQGVTVIILTVVVVAEGFGDGAPLSSCLTFFPKHDHVDKQICATPYWIELSVSSFIPSQEIDVTLMAPIGQTFIGYMLNVHRQAGDTEELLGRFTRFPSDSTKAVTCIGGKENMITHKSNTPMKELTVTWKAPEYEVGNVTFRAAFVKSFREFWTDVTNNLPSQSNVQQTVVNTILANKVSVDYDDCGKTMGCLLYPKYCNGADCDTGLTYTMTNTHTTLTFWAWTTPQSYVSVGFSDDRLMGNEETISCTYDGNIVTFQHGNNPSYYNQRQYKRDQLKDMASSYVDGKLFCTFTRPHVMNVTEYSSQITTYDLNNPYYVMIAWGHVFEGTDVMSKHTELPVTSLNPIQFNQYIIHRGDALPLLTQIHGILMLVGWILFGGLTTVIARYYRPIFPGKQLCGTSVWFQIHRAAAILTALLTAVSFIIIFVKVYGLTNDTELHGWLGIAVMSGVVLQLFGGLVRPGQTSPYRNIFNWVHWFLGKGVFIVAVVSCFVLFNTGFLPKVQEKFGNIMTALWIGLQVIWELVFEVYKRRRVGEDNKLNESTPTTPNILLVLYSVTLLALVALASLAIFFF